MRHNQLQLLCFFVCLLALPLAGRAQDRCATVFYQKSLQQRGLQETDHQFEKWLAKISQEQNLHREQDTNDVQDTKATYRIPVVVHVIYKDDGHETNISDAQILSQIKVLNDDFNRLNADSVQTPAEFKPVAGKVSIEFVLAKRTPEGLPTNGIVRVKNAKDKWFISNDYQLKSLSYWPAEDYLNIWVCNLDEYLGYAQFPESNLPGLDNFENRLTDGVVVYYKAFGSGNFPLLSRYNKGRTTTHEVGHFFGLKHIWGDDGGDCNNSNDFVGDTPDQGGHTDGCPSHPRSTCGSPDMFQNYLDYTDDGCMNLFTKGQVSRMTTILQNSPRRESLTNSFGADEPVPVANDLGIRSIISPASGVCSTVVTPVLEVRNYGTNAITGAKIRATVNGVNQPIHTFTLDLQPLEMVNVTLTNIVLATGTHTVSFQILETNGVTDANPLNNTRTQTVLVPASTTVPVSENFTIFPAGWRIVNPDNEQTWERKLLSSSNHAMKLDFYNYAENGEIDLLYTPQFSLASAPCGLLLFDVAYAQYESSLDGLQVVMLDNCNTDYTKGTTLYSKSGSQLATASATTDEFEPTTTAQWRTELKDLSSYVGQSGLQLAFIGINDYGNNLYVDNIRVVVDDIENIALLKVVVPSPGNCSNQVGPSLRVQNLGCKSITSFKVNYIVNGNSFNTTFTGLSIPAGSEYEVTLPTVSLKANENSLSFEVTQPNGNTDVDPSNNTLAYNTVINSKTSPIPLRETFETDWQQSWISINPSGDTYAWTPVAAMDAVYVNGFNNPAIGEEAWLISPIMDLSVTDTVGLYFDLSYAKRAGISETLQILGSTNCGKTFDMLLAAFSLASLTTLEATSSWQPTSEAHWMRDLFADLNSLRNKSDIRVAFVATNANGNNIYLDNIRISATHELPINTDQPYLIGPNPRNKQVSDDVEIAFNLPTRSDVRLEIINGQGQVVRSASYTNILNQRKTLPVNDDLRGLYFVRIITQTNVYVTKLVLP